MCVTVGAAVTDSARVVWASEGRSAASRARAEGAGFEDVGTLGAVTATADAVLSVCPPHGALALAEAVAATGFGGLFLDGNAVSPATAIEIEGAATASGARFVDGGIVGPPAIRPGTTRLYLSGDAARELIALFEGSALEAIDLEAEVGAASALKMCYAGFIKGSARYSCRCEPPPGPTEWSPMRSRSAERRRMARPGRSSLNATDFPWSPWHTRRRPSSMAAS